MEIKLENMMMFALGAGSKEEEDGQK